MDAIAKSFIRLIKAGRKTVDDLPAQIRPRVEELAPELFGDGGADD